MRADMRADMDICRTSLNLRFYVNRVTFTNVRRHFRDDLFIFPYYPYWTQNDDYLVHRKLQPLFRKLTGSAMRLTNLQLAVMNLKYLSIHECNYNNGH